MKRLLPLLLLSACVSTPGYYIPVIDGQGVNMARYTVDLAECRALSLQLDPNDKMVGGIVGAAGYDAMLAAVKQRQMIVMCLAGRGYRVLA